MYNQLDYNKNTVLDILRLGAEKYSDKTLLRRRIDGEWIDWSWNKIKTQVDCLASFLIDFGLNAGEIVSIYSENRPEWVVSDFGSLSCGAVNAAIYPTNSAKEAAYIINDSRSKVCFCAGKFQVDNLLAEKEKMPSLQLIVVFDDVKYDDPMIMTFSEVLEKGNAKLNRSAIEERIKNIKSDDVMTLIYSSGTTGDPKGVMLTHRNIMFISITFDRQEKLPNGFVHLSLLPLSHSVERTMDYYSVMMSGATIAYSRGTEYFAEDLKEIRPECSIYVPRVFEKLYNGILAKVREAPEKKQKIFAWATSIATAAAPYFMSNKRLPIGLAFKYAIANKLVLSKLKEAIGLDRTITWGAAGAPLARDIHDFFWGLGVQVRKGYGLTECSPVIAVDGSPTILPVKSDGWITPFPETEVKIAEDGEILARGPQIMKGYLNKPDATREMFTEDGFIKTGDIGILDDDGYLKITDRKKDIIVTAGGKNVAPQVIENTFLSNPFIEQMAIIGDARKYIVALIVPGFETLEKWAAEIGIPATDHDVLVKHPEVLKKYQTIVDEINQNFGRVEQIKKFTLLAREMTQESGELTPTLKLKRKVVAQRYKDLIDAMYVE